MEKIDIFASTDIHGEFLSFSDSKTIKKIKKDHPNAVWIDNGDFFVGNALTTYFNSTYEISPLVQEANEFNYDVMIPGNHDLDYGLEFLKKQVSQLNMPYVCCNLYDLKDEYLFEPFTVINRGNKKIAVVGVMTQALPQLAAFHATKDVVCKKVIPSVNKIIKELPDDIDLTIVAYHGGLETDLISSRTLYLETDENQAYKLGESFEQINGLIAGHQHLVNAGKINQLSMVQPGSQGNFVGKLSYELNHEQKWVSKERILAVDKEETRRSTNFEKWMNETISIPYLYEFLADYFQIETKDILYTTKGLTRRDFFNSFPHPYSMSKYVLRKEEWQEYFQYDWLKNAMQQYPLLNQEKITIYSNDQRLPSHRIQQNYIYNLFDSFHYWEMKKSIDSKL